MLLKDKDCIVFAGDSITDMGAARPFGVGPGEPLGQGYPRVFDNMLNAFHPEIRVRTVNAGISGNTSRDLRARFETDVIANEPDVVAIMIGVNDVWRHFDHPANRDHVSLQEYEENMRVIIERSLQKGARILLMTPYIMEDNEQDRMRRMMDDYSAVVRKLAGEYNTMFLDVQQLWVDYIHAGRYSMFLSSDRIHPSAIGATLLARAILHTLDITLDN
ncbi:MAG: SGNH/GDSL hydrolase family protein [Lachnospiraceae bacterium]|nr:SGNH/GDSL hydrolase family protein [Lachnospiraceae bacterium]